MRINWVYLFRNLTSSLCHCHSWIAMRHITSAICIGYKECIHFLNVKKNNNSFTISSSMPWVFKLLIWSFSSTVFHIHKFISEGRWVGGMVYYIKLGLIKSPGKNIKELFVQFASVTTNALAFCGIVFKIFHLSIFFTYTIFWTFVTGSAYST